QELLAGTSREVFQNVFAVGLHELQQLAALQTEEIAERMYGVSLGSDGRRLLAALARAAGAKRELFDPEENAGRMFDLMHRDEELAVKLHTLGPQRDEYDRLHGERQRVVDAIAEMKSRRAGMASQLRGHQFLRSVFPPWKQVCEYRDQLSETPELDDFPENGLERLRELESEMQSDERCRRSLRSEIEQLKTKRAEIQANNKFLKHAGRLRRCVKRRDSMAAVENEVQSAAERVRLLDRELEEHCRELGPDWTRPRLATVDVSPASQWTLMQAARSFQAAVVRRGRFRKVYKSADRSFRKLRNQAKDAPAEMQSETLPAAVERETRRLQSAEDRRRLQDRITELETRMTELGDASPESPMVVPKWFRRVLWFFTAAGGGVAVIGLATSLFLNAGAGLVLALSGLTGLGVSRGMQYFRERDPVEGGDRRRRQMKRIEDELMQTRSELQRLSGNDADTDGNEAPESLLPVVQRLVRFETERRTTRRLDAARRRMIKMRNRAGRVRQGFSQARQNWCDTQSRAGLDVALKPDDAFGHFEAVSQARVLLERLNAAERDERRNRRRFDRQMQSIRRLATRLEAPLGEDDDPLAKLDDWARRLENLDSVREDARRLKDDVRILKREHAALLQQGGAADRDEFERRAEALSQRAELDELLALANEELREAAAREPEMAIVEEDLQQFDPDENDRCIEALETEIADINADLQRTHEELGGVKRAIAELESHRRGSALRFERAQLESELADALTDWMAEHLVEIALASLKSRFERERQPPVLAKASEFLHRLTGRRYGRVWTPLGRRRLRIDDAHRDTWGLGDLSGGTREQVFLALRLALIEAFVDSGVELPIILDDVLVNFDRTRTEAAVAMLKRLAEEGRQIIFLTCHEHIADQFRRHGVQPLALPARDEASHQQRLAG
ncbi:MAG: ATP-binding protein, partial [Planctomycetaceae bacterium]